MTMSLQLNFFLVITLMRMFRVRGHLAARTDPLGLKPIPSLAVCGWYPVPLARITALG